MDSVSLACCVACSALYFNTLDTGFVYDDRRAVLSNADVLTSTPLHRLWLNDFWGTPLAHSGSHGSYRPLIVLSYRLNYMIGGYQASHYHLVNVLLHCLATSLVVRLARRLLRSAAHLLARHRLLYHDIVLQASHCHLVNVLLHCLATSLVVRLARRLLPSAANLLASHRLLYHDIVLQASHYHLVNVLLHCLATSLVVRLARRLLPSAAHLSALVAGLLFAAHPVHTEAVAGVVGRADVACCVFYLASFLCYVEHVAHRDARGRRSCLNCQDLTNNNDSQFCLNNNNNNINNNNNTNRPRNKPAKFFYKTTQRKLDCSTCARCTEPVPRCAQCCDLLAKCAACTPREPCRRCGERLRRCGNCARACATCEEAVTTCGNCASTLTTWCYLLACVLLAVCALLCKEMGITVLPLCFIYDVIVHYAKLRGYAENMRKIPHRLLISLSSLLLSLLILLTIRLHFLTFSTPTFSTADNPTARCPSLLTRSLTFLYLPVFNFLLLLYPQQLSFDWSMDAIPRIASLSDPRNILTVSFYLAMYLVVKRNLHKVASVKSQAAFWSRKTSRHQKFGRRIGNAAGQEHNKSLNKTRKISIEKSSNNNTSVVNRNAVVSKTQDRVVAVERQGAKTEKASVKVAVLPKEEVQQVVEKVSQPEPCPVCSHKLTDHHSTQCRNTNNNNTISQQGVSSSCHCKTDDDVRASTLEEECGLGVLGKVTATLRKLFRRRTEGGECCGDVDNEECNRMKDVEEEGFGVDRIYGKKRFGFEEVFREVLDEESGMILESCGRVREDCDEPEMKDSGLVGSVNESEDGRIFWRRANEDCLAAETRKSSSSRQTITEEPEDTRPNHRKGFWRPPKPHRKGNESLIKRWFCKAKQSWSKPHIESRRRASPDTSQAVLLSVAFLAVPFLPATNLFFHVGFVVAERLLYIPSVGYSLLVALGCQAVMRRANKRVAAAVIVVMIATMAARTVQRNRDWRDEESLYRSGVDINPPKSYGNLGSVLSSQGRLAEAEWAFKMALKYRSNMADVHYNLGVLLERKGQHDEAIECYQRAIQYRHTLALAYVQLGRLLEREGRLEEAAILYMRCARIDSAGLKDPRGHETARVTASLQLGKLLSAQGRYAQAAQVYAQAVEIMPVDYQPQVLYALLAETHSRLRHYVEAERWCRMALRAQPDHLQALITYGNTLARNKSRVMEAERWFKRATEIAPADPTVYRHFGQFLATLERHQEAAQLLVKAAQLSPDEPDAVLGAAMALRQAGHRRQAEDFYRLAVRLSPQEARSHLNLGAILHMNGKYPEAESCYLEALRIQPDDATALSNLSKLRSTVARLQIT